MALLNLSKYNFNDYENRVDSTVKIIDAIPNRNEGYSAPGGDVVGNISVGDVLAIGVIPKNSLITDIRVLYTQAFPDNATFDFGFLADFPDDALITFTTGVVADHEDLQQFIPLSNSGCVDADGVQVTTEEADYRGGIWNGDKRPLMLAVRVNGDGGDGTAITVGKCKVLISYIRFSNDDVVRGQKII